MIGLLVSAGNATPVYGVLYRTVPGFAQWHAPSRFFFMPAYGPQAARAPDFALVHASAVVLPALLALALAVRGGPWSYVLPGIVALDLLAFHLPRSIGTFFEL